MSKSAFKMIVNNALNNIGNKTTAYQIEQQYKNNPPTPGKLIEIKNLRRKYNENMTLSSAEYNLEMNNLAEKYKRLDAGFMKKAMEEELEILKRPIKKSIKTV
jgi:arsenate reductase-like glutaredoxin family protein